MTPERRRALKQALLDGGHSHEDAEQILDLSVFAVQSAGLRIAEIAHSAASPTLEAQILFLSAQLMDGIYQKYIEDIKKLAGAHLGEVVA